ncbi:hypothetical protein BDN71DRAFT_1431210 [Pleurotus eryngii]|uniref:Uncharacterized protein n=1 Tax=Pleurotus eryngii TaxID=5323 RepID=A0A9P6D6W9_PLEER|nr:hypothetical protein BDN71DRAFT_1431210 [Pleurotus eryngii]
MSHPTSTSEPQTPLAMPATYIPDESPLPPLTPSTNDLSLNQDVRMGASYSSVAATNTRVRFSTPQETSPLQEVTPIGSPRASDVSLNARIFICNNPEESRCAKELLTQDQKDMILRCSTSVQVTDDNSMDNESMPKDKGKGVDPREHGKPVLQLGKLAPFLNEFSAPTEEEVAEQWAAFEFWQPEPTLTSSLKIPKASASSKVVPNIHPNNITLAELIKSLKVIQDQFNELELQVQSKSD